MKTPIHEAAGDGAVLQRGEIRSVALETWLDDPVASLRPMLREGARSLERLPARPS